MWVKYFSKKQIIILGIIFSALIFGTIVFISRPQKEPQVIPVLPPSAPSALKAEVISEPYVSFSWTASSASVGDKVTYNIYQEGIYMGHTKSTDYSVVGLEPETTYDFFVEAFQTVENVSEPSEVLTITTPQATEVSVEGLTTRIVGYYASWAAREGFTPDQLDASKVTHINYAFANIDDALKITLGDPEIDPLNFEKLNALKTINPELKILISVGGWTWSDKFSDMAVTDASRSAFAESCVDFMIQYGLDGVDLDWEYPVAGGELGNSKRPEDKENFTLLLKVLREKLDAQGLIDGQAYLLTIAGGAANSYIQNTELSVLHQYLDFANLMTYDIHGGWEGLTDFNAPLYVDATSKQDKWSVEAAVSAWLAAGFPAEKLVVGVPFYGNKYNAARNLNDGLYQSFTGCTYTGYHEITNKYLNQAGYERFFRESSMVPWLYNGTNFICYEDQQSLALKAAYIQANQLGGVMIWELSHDPDAILLTTLCRGLK